MRRIIFLGPPGAGKGTQARIICQQLGIAQISTGDLLRQEIKQRTAIGVELEDIINSGALVPDRCMLDMISERIGHNDCQRGYLLDGFPRTTGQAQGCLDRGIKVDCVLALSVDDDIIVERLSGRRMHLPSGRTYHIVHNPPKVPGRDDVSGEELVQRPDDRPDTVRRRLRLYREQTAELISFYRSVAGIQLYEADGSADIDTVAARIRQCLSVDRDQALASSS